MAPFPVFRSLHLIHHNHTNNPEKDPDFWVASRTIPTLIARCLTIYFAYHYHYVKNIAQLSRNGKTKKGIIASAVVFLAMNSLIVFSGIQFGWHYVLAIYVLPAIFALAFLAFAFDWLPHHPHAIQQKYLDTRIILRPGLSTILVSQNMHLIHHLYSGIPFYHYADAYKVLEKKLKEEGARVEGSH